MLTNSNLPVVVIASLRVLAGEEKAFDLVGRVQRPALLRVELVGVALQHAAQVAGVWLAVLVDDGAEDQHLAGAEDVGGHPVEGAPVDAQAQVAFLLRREAADGRAVEGQIVVAVEQELLVVVEQMDAAFEVGEHDRHCLDVLLVGQILQALFADLVRIDAVQAFGFRLQVQLFQFVIAQSQEVAILG